MKTRSAFVAKIRLNSDTVDIVRLSPRRKRKRSAMIGGDVISVLLRQVLLIAGPMLGVALLAWAIRGVLVVWDPWKPSPAARRRDGVASIAFIVGLLALVGAIAESMTSESY